MILYLSFAEILTYLKMFPSVNRSEGAAKFRRIANVQRIFAKIMNNLT